MDDRLFVCKQMSGGACVWCSAASRQRCMQATHTVDRIRSCQSQEHLLQRDKMDECRNETVVRVTGLSCFRRRPQILAFLYKFNSLFDWLFDSYVLI